MRPIQLPPEINYRGFMLGIADQETESRAEEAILAGSIDSAFLEFFEEELIDDYLFGNLSPDEERRFRDHFLCTDDRRERLAIAQAIKQYAGEQPASVFEVRDKLSSWKFRTPHFPWMMATVAAVAASFVLAVLLGFQFLHVKKEAEVVRNGESEVERLQAALATQKLKPSYPTESAGSLAPLPKRQNNQSHSTEVVPDLVLTPGQTRGPDARKGSDSRNDLQISPSKRLVLIELVLPALSGEWYREELVTSNETPLLIQDIPIHGSQPESRSTIAVQAAKLPPGDYQVRLLVASSDRQFQEYESYGFRVKRP